MNPFRHLLKRSGSQPPIGTWLLSASPLLAEAAGHAGFDWGVIDMEHGPLDMGDVVHLLQAVAGTRLVPVVRVPWNDTVTIKRVLDAGATTSCWACRSPAVQNQGVPPARRQACSSASRGGSSASTTLMSTSDFASASPSTTDPDTKASSELSSSPRWASATRCAS